MFKLNMAILNSLILAFASYGISEQAQALSADVSSTPQVQAKIFTLGGELPIAAGTIAGEKKVSDLEHQFVANHDLKTLVAKSTHSKTIVYGRAKPTEDKDKPF